jgi:hypothetical protein
VFPHALTVKGHSLDFRSFWIETGPGIRASRFGAQSPQTSGDYEQPS